jgi:hypothetical protein
MSDKKGLDKELSLSKQTKWFELLRNTTGRLEDLLRDGVIHVPEQSTVSKDTYAKEGVQRYLLDNQLKSAQ